MSSFRTDNIPKYKNKSDTQSLHNGDKNKLWNGGCIRDRQHHYNYCVMDIVIGRYIDTRTVCQTVWNVLAPIRSTLENILMAMTLLLASVCYNLPSNMLLAQWYCILVKPPHGARYFFRTGRVRCSGRQWNKRTVLLQVLLWLWPKGHLEFVQSNGNPTKNSTITELWHKSR